jgi:hypothetical protein
LSCAGDKPILTLIKALSNVQETESAVIALNFENDSVQFLEVCGRAEEQALRALVRHNFLQKSCLLSDSNEKRPIVAKKF